MFNLEPSIAEWRRQMAAAGIKSPTVLDELESHLREDVEHRMHSGASAETAFEHAVARIGAGGLLNGEFAKVRRSGARFNEHPVRIACLAVAAFVFAVETWTLLIYDVPILQRIFGIGLVALI